ncbi:LPXTG cell wall anchor domain-containing protein [Micromonospora sp. LAH09]|uniref:SdrD B-like domain-containing protein n=1 Tax=Micromonospora cabrerizensis TaxID=2911213 RepID=UPI001EE802D4|nr:SdrD B-like domain-containing protein [Micromonospora cabrerizensis]MCG5468902.1 LPXTG cell wall anchor domain-containing protein [Micromonospora cabrerizensis]
MRTLAAAALVGVFVAVLPASAALAAAPEPDIAVTSAADKANYTEGEIFTVTVTVKNKSSVDAKHVHYTGGDSEGVDGVVYGELRTGFDLAAGATKTVRITGKTNHLASQSGYGFVAFSLAADNGEANDADNNTSVRLLVAGVFDDLGGYVFQGGSSGAEWTPRTPGVPGVKVVATSADGKTKYAEAITDAKGLFRFARLPAGDVLLTFTAPTGWKILAGENGEDDHTLAQVRADDSDEPSIFVPAKKVAVSSPTVSPSASASASAGPALPVSGDNSDGPALPITGDKTMLLVGAAAVAVVVGIAMVLVARRRRVHLQA